VNCATTASTERVATDSRYWTSDDSAKELVASSVS
jgi:hypothetical protein